MVGTLSALAICANLMFHSNLFFYYCLFFFRLLHYTMHVNCTCHHYVRGLFWSSMFVWEPSVSFLHSSPHNKFFYFKYRLNFIHYNGTVVIFWKNYINFSSHFQGFHNQGNSFEKDHDCMCVCVGGGLININSIYYTVCSKYICLSLCSNLLALFRTAFCK